MRFNARTKHVELRPKCVKNAPVLGTHWEGMLTSVAYSVVIASTAMGSHRNSHVPI